MGDEVVFLDRPVECRIEGGIVLAEAHSGDRVFLFAMSPHNLRDSIALASATLAQWQVEQLDRVVEMG